MASNYYYFISGLPDISFSDTKKKLDLYLIKESLKQNIDPEDYYLIDLFYYKFDNQNIINILLNKDFAFNPIGNFNQLEIEEELKRIKDEGKKSNGLFPEYLQDFIHQYYINQENKVTLENDLSLAYFNYALSLDNIFIKNIFRFEMILRNFLAATLSRKYNLEYENEILGNDEISLMIKRSNAKDYNISGEFEYTSQLLQIADIEDIIEREKKTDQLRWNKIDDAIFFHYFTIERIYAYMLKLEIINRWLDLEKEKGKHKFNEVLNKLQSSYEFPKETLIYSNSQQRNS